MIDFRAAPEKQCDHTWIKDGWDVIGFTIRNIDPIDMACESHVPYYIRYSAELQAVAGVAANEITWVGGGSGFSLFANELTTLMNLDVGVVGPGEAAMRRICSKPRESRGTGRVINGSPDTAFADRVMHYNADLIREYAADKSATIGVETRRKSCYQGCTYCPYAHITKEDLGSSRRVDRLLAEIAGVYSSGARNIFFTDGIFNAELRFAKQVVEALNRADLPDLRWSAYFTPKPFDEEFAALLAGSDVEGIVISPDSLHPGMMNWGSPSMCGM